MMIEQCWARKINVYEAPYLWTIIDLMSTEKTSPGVGVRAQFCILSASKIRAQETTPFNTTPQCLATQQHPTAPSPIHMCPQRRLRLLVSSSPPVLSSPL